MGLSEEQIPCMKRLMTNRAYWKQQAEVGNPNAAHEPALAASVASSTSAATTTTTTAANTNTTLSTGQTSARAEGAPGPSSARERERDREAAAHSHRDRGDRGDRDREGAAGPGPLSTATKDSSQPLSGSLIPPLDRRASGQLLRQGSGSSLINTTAANSKRKTSLAPLPTIPDAAPRKLQREGSHSRSMIAVPFVGSDKDKDKEKDKPQDSV